MNDEDDFLAKRIDNLNLTVNVNNYELTKKIDDLTNVVNVENLKLTNMMEELIGNISIDHEAIMKRINCKCFFFRVRFFNFALAHRKDTTRKNNLVY